MKNRLRELRIRAQLTQKQLANYLKIDQSMVAKLENGTRNFNMTLMDRICSLFGCTEEYLLMEDDFYSPLTFAFRAQEITENDLESIAAVNKIILNLREMNEIMKENENEIKN